MRIASHATIATFGLIVFLAQGAAAIAAEVKVMAGAAMRGAFGELVPQFERATGHKIAIEYGAGTTFRKQIEAGETSSQSQASRHYCPPRACRSWVPCRGSCRAGS